MPTPFVSQNPFTGQKMQAFTATSQESAKKQLEELHLAHLSWRRTPLADRLNVISTLGDQLLAQEDHLATTITLEMGKPISQSRAEIQKCASLCHYYVALAPEQLSERSIFLDSPYQGTVRHDPLGVICAVMPWNFPFWQVFRAVIGAIIAGNTILLKHAANTPQCAQLIDALFRAASPDLTVLQNVFVDHESLASLIQSRLVRGVTLTGSLRAGAAVATAAATQVKPVVLELGGSDPFLVFDDADLEKAAKTAADSRLMNNGQSCICAKRFFVHSAVFDAFAQAFIGHLSQKRLGDPMDTATDIGPLATAQQKQTLFDQVADAKSKGATVLYEGMSPASAGLFFAPTVLAQVTPNMRAFSEELFGPVAVLAPFETEQEALDLANQSDFGLGATIFTEDQKRAERLSAGLDCGTVFINAMVRSDARLPFGGTKLSGYGRELSTAGLLAFTNEKSVWH